MHTFARKATVVAVGFAVSASSLPAFAAEPIVKGPESVQDWFNQGSKFIRHSEKIVDNHSRAKNVILFVGDGTGISTLTAARILEGQLNGKPGEENRLSFENFPNLALSKTYSWDQQTSDSAPTMTAMVTGYELTDSLIKRADASLYKAKSSGRNRVVANYQESQVHRTRNL